VVKLEEATADEAEVKDETDTAGSEDRPSILL